MNASTLPPTKVKAPVTPAAPKAAKEPKAVKPPKDPNAPKTPRGPRKDYGYAAGSTIKMLVTETKYRGQRLEWFNHLKAADGKTVEKFLEATKAMKDPGRGWLRFFVQDEACTLIPPPKAPEAPKDAPAAA